MFSPLLENVTNKYFPVSEITLHTSLASTDIYLTTFNRGTFKAVAYAHSDTKGNAFFSHITENLLYFPMQLTNQIFQPAGDPFIPDTTGKLHIIQPIRDTILLNDLHLYDVHRCLTLKHKTYTLY